jgi:hypothetical protein
MTRLQPLLLPLLVIASVWGILWAAMSIAFARFEASHLDRRKDWAAPPKPGYDYIARRKIQDRWSGRSLTSKRSSHGE